MSTSKITGLIRCAIKKVAKLSKANPKNMKIGLLTAALIAIPALVEASNGEIKPQEPLSTEQSDQLKQRLAEFSPTAQNEPEKIEMEVIPPEPEPQPEPEPAPAPAPARPQPRRATNPAPRQTARRAPVAATRTANSGTSWEQCVPFARRVSGVQVRGYAGDIRPNSQEASVGSVALFAGYGHAAVVTGVNGDSVTIKEANYVPGKITERTVPKSQLRGYVK